MANFAKKWQDISRRYRSYMRLEKHLSENTIEAYMEDNTFDLLMDNWDDLNEDVLNYIEEEGLGSNDEEDDEDNDDEDSDDFINRLLMEEAEREKEDED